MTRVLDVLYIPNCTNADVHRDRNIEYVYDARD